MITPLTRVALESQRSHVNVYLRFGQPMYWRRVDRHRRHAFFGPGSVFCRIEWLGGSYGTTFWRLMILQAGKPGQNLQSVMGVTPGARALLQAEGRGQVKRVLRLIKHIESQTIRPINVPPQYWIAMYNRLAGRGRLSPYRADRHAAELARRAIK